MIAESVVLHVNPNKIIQSWGWETENSRNLFCMEQVGGFVPVDPHPSKVITKKIVEGISGEKTQAVWNPVRLIARVIEVWFCSSSEVTDCLCALFICSRPNSESNSVKCVARILLKNVCVVDAMRLASASADFNIMRETSLGVSVNWWQLSIDASLPS